MRALFPKAPSSPIAVPHNVPVCEWIMPARMAWRRDYFSIYKVLPPGKPDCLEVSVRHDGQGTERCTAAIYGAYAYLIHYEFKDHSQR